MKSRRNRWKDPLLTFLILGLCFGCSVLMQDVFAISEQVTTSFVFAVFLISLLTDGYFYGILAAFISMFAVNYAFTFPYFALNFIIPSNFYSALVMIILSVMTSTLTTKIKQQEQLRAESEMEKMRANLLRAISHDLRTPLTAISGNAGILMENASVLDAAKRRQLYTSIYDDSMWLANLVENLLSVSRIENGTIRLKIEPELLEEVFQEALTHLDRKAKEHTITVELPDDMLMAKMDARLIVQVVINIVNNAIKYTPPGSHVQVSARKRGESVEVRIADDGPGISDEAKAKLFDMFYTANNARGDGRRGLGLGLSLCRSIVQAHGGSITVEDNYPKGAIFSFTLPLAEVNTDEQTSNLDH